MLRFRFAKIGDWCLMLDAGLMVHGSRLMAHGQGRGCRGRGLITSWGAPGLGAGAMKQHASFANHKPKVLVTVRGWYVAL